MMRIGVLGTDSGHVDEFIRHFNDESRFPDLRITAALADHPNRDGQLAGLGLQVFETVDQVVEACDGIIVADRRGSLHLDLARLALVAGLPTFVDKPFSNDLADAREMLTLAEQHGARIASCSVLRLNPALSHPRSDADLVRVQGPADPASPHEGLFFYGIHSAEVAAAIALTGGTGLPIDVQVQAVGGAVVVSALLAGRRVELVLDPGLEGFHVGDEPLLLGDDYLLPTSRVIAELMNGEDVPDMAPTLAAVSLLQQAVEHL